MDLYHKLFQYLHEGILITDKFSNIVYCNDSYLNFIDKKFDEVDRKPIYEFRPGARLPQVIETGKPVFGLLRKEGSQEYFVNIYPIVDSNQISGAISIVTFLNDARVVKDTLEDLDRQRRFLAQRIKESNGAHYTFEDIVAVSEVSKATKEFAKKIATSDVDVLIQGESGTGKELYAQSIHNESKRNMYPFVAINCSTFSRDILESELFGYEDGAFTGAIKGGKIGLFEAAEGGTIFLDEISEMNINLQSKLLRVLQERKIRRVGGHKEIPINVRVISACNVNLSEYIEKGKFRDDLFYRISTIPIKIAPLRERKEDILELSSIFINSLRTRLKRNFSLSERSKLLIGCYAWPGNIRELKNVIEFSAVMSDDDILDTDNFPPKIVESSNVSSETSTLKNRTIEFEGMEIIKELDKNDQNKVKVAEILGISLASLYNKINLYKNLEKSQN